MSVTLADAIFWIAVASCTIAQLAIIRSAVVSPVQTADTAAPASNWRRASEIAWAVLPGIALIFVFVLTWRAIHSGGSATGIIG